MAHELTIKDGIAEMAYTGAMPWHKLGQKLAEGATLAEWQQAAGMGWTVEAQPVGFNAGGEFRQMDDRRVLYRSDNFRPLSVVSDEYHIVQPYDVLKYFDDLAQSAGFKLVTAGTLFGGRQFWAQAEIGEADYIADKKDFVRGKVLFATSVDLTLPSQIKFVAETVVCNNTLTWALNEGGKSVAVRHRTAFNADKVNDKLGILAKGAFASTIETLRVLARTKLTPEQVAVATVALCKPDAFELPQEDFLRVISKSKPMARIAQLSINNDMIGGDLKGHKGTAWGWLNATTQYVDHELRSRSDDWSTQRAWFGDGSKLKARAYAMAQTVPDHKHADMTAADILDVLMSKPSSLGQRDEELVAA